jgi:hypothetical protein
MDIICAWDEDSRGTVQPALYIQPCECGGVPAHYSYSIKLYQVRPNEIHRNAPANRHENSVNQSAGPAKLEP